MLDLLFFCKFLVNIFIREISIMSCMWFFARLICALIFIYPRGIVPRRIPGGEIGVGVCHTWYKTCHLLISRMKLYPTYFVLSVLPLPSSFIINNFYVYQGLSSAADSSAVVYQNKVKPTFKELAAEYKKVKIYEIEFYF